MTLPLPLDGMTGISQIVGISGDREKAVSFQMVGVVAMDEIK